MNQEVTMQNDNIDKEWLDLLIAAKELGLTIKQIREFFGERLHEIEDNM